MRWSDVQFNPTVRTLRQFAGLFLVVFGVLAAMELYAGVRPRLAIAYGAAALVVGGIGLVRPRAVRLLFVGWSIVAFPIGWMISTVMLGILFYGLFTPIGIVFRLVGRDALAIRRPDAPTYWKPKVGAKHSREYFRQS